MHGTIDEFEEHLERGEPPCLLCVRAFMEDIEESQDSDLSDPVNSDGR